MNYIIIVAAFQSLIALILAVFFKVRKNDDRDSVLAMLLSAIFLHLFGNFILNVFVPDSETHKQFNTFIGLMYPVFLWCYASRLAGVRKKWEKQDLLHFLPALIASVVYFIIAVHTIRHQGKTPSMIHQYNTYSGYAYIVLFSVYGTLSIGLLKRIPAFWNTEKRFVKLASLLLISIAVYWILVIILKRTFPEIFNGIDLHLWSRIFFYLVLLTLCLAIAFVKLREMYYLRTETSSADQNAEDNTQALLSLTENKRIASSAVNYVPIIQKVEKLMEQDKVYTDSELTLDRLASMINVSRHHLSESINQYLGKTFYQYINEYRIRKVVEMMDEYKEKRVSPNILSLAFEAGFHSKSSFNQYFKKVMDCTPSAYLKKAGADLRPTITAHA